ncbi:cytochrome c oxidase assembly protein [Corynebacterium sp. TAE3-ERU12]|uniref:cytochrome c oxidase assembly protein n=1 Tax=Corynebacterium sp. TAE3-ERU12 TaxID=2849491 RepID=UPI001C45E76E|nr:cytochrome c oxidase assembly protein [Corynebacterium sp. TAE3-ERU12]MBV7294943.1 cytochrome c oxidase assembly protein [Corynebacterium sp. TAE3-ERU12]
MTATTADPVHPTDSAHPESSPATGRKRVRRTVGWYLLFALIAGSLAGGLSLWFNSESRTTLGVPDPGVITTIGFPLAKAGGEIFASLATGSFMLAAFATKRRPDGTLDLDGYAASRTGMWSIAAWGCIGLLQIPLVLSDVSGLPLSQTIQPQNWSVALDQVSEAVAWLWVGIFSLVCALGAALTRKWIWQPVFFALSLLSMMPLAVVSHNATGGNHDYGTNSYIWHLTFTVLWVGGLMALIGHARRRGRFLDVAVARYSFVALVAFIAMTVSGVINAWINLGWHDLFTSTYGVLVVIKAVAIIVLGLVGYLHRQITIPKIKNDPFGFAFRRLAIVEVIIMALTIGVAVALSRTPPPPQYAEQAGGTGELPEITQMEVKLGYKLDIPFGWEALFSTFRFDVFFGSAAIIAAAIYLYWVYLLKKRGGQWPTSYIVWWLSGCALLLFTSCSALGVYMPALFSVHMLAHMIYSMAVPVMLCLGGPMTLGLRALKPCGKDGVPGLREWLVVFINNPVSRFLTNPLVATVQFVAGFYIMYMTPIFGALADEHAGHLFMNIHFLISGYIFYWVIIGVDAAPQRIPESIKLVTLMGSLPFHAFFGIALMQMSQVMALDYYSTLDLPWQVNLLEDQNTGGAIAWALGEVPMFIVMAALFVQWRNSDEREARRYDRKAERDNDAELQAYNQMLAEMGQGREPGSSRYFTSSVDQDHEMHLDNPVRSETVRKMK